MTIKFKYKGPMRVGFADIGRELDPGEKFDVPEHLALSFDGHGHCTCLEPSKLAPLRAAAEAEQAAQEAARDAAGLVYAHPVAAAAAIERAAAAAAQEPLPTPTPAVEETPATAVETASPAPSASKRTKPDPPASATATATAK